MSLLCCASELQPDYFQKDAFTASFSSVSPAVVQAVNQQGPKSEQNVSEAWTKETHWLT